MMDGLLLRSRAISAQQTTKDAFKYVWDDDKIIGFLNYDFEVLANGFEAYVWASEERERSDNPPSIPMDATLQEKLADLPLERYTTMVVFAIISGYLSPAKMIMQKPECINCFSDPVRCSPAYQTTRLTPLFAAAYVGNLDLCQYLLENKADPNLVCTYNHSLLDDYPPAWSRVSFLDPEDRDAWRLSMIPDFPNDKSSGSALTAAVKKKKLDTDLVELLLRHGADPYNPHSAESYDGLERFLQSLKTGCDRTSGSPGMIAFHLAITRGLWQHAKDYAKSSDYCHSEEFEGPTPLHECAANLTCPQILQVAKQLLETGANINAIDRAGRAPLHRAASNAPSVETLDFIKFLIQNSAIVDPEDEQGATPLHSAAEVLTTSPKTDGTVELRDMDVRVFEYLLYEANANPGLRRRTGQSPIQTLLEGLGVAEEDVRNGQASICPPFNPRIHQCLRKMGDNIQAEIQRDYERARSMQMEQQQTTGAGASDFREFDMDDLESLEDFSGDSDLDEYDDLGDEDGLYDAYQTIT